METLNFKELDEGLGGKYYRGISYKEDKYLVIKDFNKANNTNYQYFTEMIYDLFKNKDYTPYTIGLLFDMTNVAIRYHLKTKMKCKMLSCGGYHGFDSKTGIPGVYPYGNNGKFVVWCYYKKKKYVGVYDTIFEGAWALRRMEIRHGFPFRSKSQEYINKYWMDFAKTP